MVATLLDFDGVLVDSEPVHLAAFNDVLARFDIAIGEREYLERYFSLDDAGVFRAVLRAAGRALVDDEVRDLVAAKSPSFMRRFEDAFRVFPGAPELVRRRAARGPVGIVSGALAAEIAFALGKMGVASHVTFIVAAEHVAASKPDPAPFRAGIDAVRRLGHAGAIVAVEDSLGGVRSARGAGLRCVAVAHSYGADELREAGADAVVADLAALTDAVVEGTG